MQKSHDNVHMEEVVGEEETSDDSEMLLLGMLRGVANRKSQRQIKDILLRVKPCLLMLFQTHTIFAKTEAFWFHIGYGKAVIEEARDQSGGVWILALLGNIFTFQVLDSGPQAISMLVFSGSSIWICIAVYANIQLQT
ncbi:hypothetical protein VNO78_11762 [Psophocarpus tetragonolobus]|uniref:Uncharacterized protein n=1 Tax=Psophocarpus tetragonolobus TaxID=3891 RepID=A0AAN9XPA8_PSOTE